MSENKEKETEKENQNSDPNGKEHSKIDEVDKFLNSIGDYLRLPQRDGESMTYRFFKDKSKRSLVQITFTDPVTEEIKKQTKVRYFAIHPSYPEYGEKPLEVPKTLAQQIEDNIAAGHLLQRIVRHGTGPNTRYNSTAVST